MLLHECVPYRLDIHIYRFCNSRLRLKGAHKRFPHGSKTQQNHLLSTTIYATIYYDGAGTAISPFILMLEVIVGTRQF